MKSLLNDAFNPKRGKGVWIQPLPLDIMRNDFVMKKFNAPCFRNSFVSSLAQILMQFFLKYHYWRTSAKLCNIM